MSYYFTKFPTMLYDFIVNNQRVFYMVRDITINVRFRKELLTNVVQYEHYDIQDGETPEIISEKFYGTPHYHWVIMILNEKYDYVDDFPLSTFELENFITAKYGAGHEHDINHWEDPNTGYIVDSDFPGAVYVDNYNYETQVNEAKRRIKIIAPELLSVILKQFDELI